MFITAVCVIFLIKLRWPKNKSLFHKLPLCIESKAFSKSTKCMYRLTLHSFAYSKMFLNIRICSVVLLSALNPACSFRSFLSIPILILSSIILQNTLLMMGSKVTPLQLLQSRKSPFLNMLTISPFFHTFGHLSAFQSLL